MTMSSMPPPSVIVHEDETDMSMGSTWSSNWNASIRAHFPWLASSASISQLQDDSLNDKVQEIRACLDGDDLVDLWHLRELALTRGGLVSCLVRKRAWPKLTGAHRQVLLHASGGDTVSSAQMLEVTKQDMDLLHADLTSHAVWNIQEQVWVNREEERVRKVSFVPGLAAVSPALSSGGNPPSSITTNAIDDHDEEQTSTIVSTNPSITSTRTSPQEQRAIRNTLVSVLRTRPPMNDNSTTCTRRYHYYPGLHDLTALLLINLESPSLASLILTKLASHSLRDALSRDLHQAIPMVFVPLLKKVDPRLSRKLPEGTSAVVQQWVQSWFASHATHVRAASRLADVFLVSHATMPMYVLCAE